LHELKRIEEIPRRQKQTLVSQFPSDRNQSSEKNRDHLAESYVVASGPWRFFPFVSGNVWISAKAISEPRQLFEAPSNLAGDRFFMTSLADKSGTERKEFECKEQIYDITWEQNLRAPQKPRICGI
jgi:hypothetical protein